MTATGSAGGEARARQTVTHLGVDELVAHPGNIRDDLGDLGEMASSVREHGILQPLTVTENPDGGYVVLAGHRRLAAAKLAHLSRVPVVIRHELDALDEHLVLMLVENTQRRDLNPMERAEAYDALRNIGLTPSDIARRTGTTPGNVSYYLNLTLLDEREREQVRAGTRAAHRTIAQVQAAKQAQRVVQEKRPRGRPKGAKTRPYFSEAHPLADQARATCGHRGRPKVGSVACGPCWEQAIRNDIEGTVAPAPEYAAPDQSVVDAILAGAWKTPCGPAEKAAVARRWLIGGQGTLNQLEAYTGWNMARYFKTDDLFEQESS